MNQYVRSPDFRLQHHASQAGKLQIAADKPYAGPVTLARWRRSALVYIAMALLGCALGWSNEPRLASFGLGLLIPGGGFLLHGGLGLANALLHFALFAGSMLLFAAALFLWVATGNLLAPLALWLGTAVAAAAMDHWSAGATFTGMRTLCSGGITGLRLLDVRVLLPLALLLSAVAGLHGLRRRYHWLQSERSRINDFLRATEPHVASPTDLATGLPKTAPLSEADLPLWRYILDRALQPVADFNGFDRIDEFREAAKRYQLCNLSYMLSIHQYTRTPAFRGYQHEAQQRLSLKMMDHRVWSYWRLENLWGNLRSDPNPLGRDNIMYYGWYGGMLGMQLSNSGDERYCKPGSILLQHPNGTQYRSSFTEICELLRSNMRESAFCLFPCEPRWIYPICNNFGALSLKLHDRHFGTHWWGEMEAPYRRGLEDEFITMNGRITAIRDYYTGMTVPALTATMADAVTALFLHPVLPDVARRSWAIIRHELIRVADGRVHVQTNGWDKIDFGNYRRTLISTYALIAASAREMGDDEVADLLLQRIDAEYEHVLTGGVRHYPGASVSAHAVIHAARILRTNGLHDLVAQGMPRAWREGPLLEEARYPDVLVAGAVSDGAALDLQLCPGSAAGRYSLGLSQLRPGKPYRLSGAVTNALTADASGRASLQVDLDRMQALRITPQE